MTADEIARLIIAELQRQIAAGDGVLVDYSDDGMPGETRGVRIDATIDFDVLGRVLEVRTRQDRDEATERAAEICEQNAVIHRSIPEIAKLIRLHKEA